MKTPQPVSACAATTMPRGRRVDVAAAAFTSTRRATAVSTREQFAAAASSQNPDAPVGETASQRKWAMAV